MKEILLKFLTQKGEKAYNLIEAEGKAQPKSDRLIAKSLARDSIIKKNPLVVKIKVKIKRLAIASKLNEQVVKALEKAGAKKDVDFTIEVFW